MFLSARHSVRGFTLTELAIVLGVIGGILGGIWTAASMVQQNLKINKAQQELEIIVSNVRTLYSTRGSFLNSTQTDMTAALMNANVFPADMIVAGQANPLDPWGNTVKVYQSSSAPGANNMVFEVWFSNMPSPNCAQLLARVVGNGSDSSLLQVDDGPDGWESATTGTLDATSFKSCNWASFEYNLNG